VPGSRNKSQSTFEVPAVTLPVILLFPTKLITPEGLDKDAFWDYFKKSLLNKVQML
jgi:hypothetical protein